MNERKLVVYIAMSLDGYIAAPGDDLSFLDKVQVKGEDYGYGAFIKTVDTVLIGRRTYDWVMKQVPVFPHADMETYVISQNVREAAGNVQFYTGDPGELVTRLKSRPGKNIFCDGGALLIRSLMIQRLIDEWTISIIPVFLGDGVRLFPSGYPPQDLLLLDCRSYKSGLVQLHYSRPPL